MLRLAPFHSAGDQFVDALGQMLAHLVRQAGKITPPRKYSSPNPHRTELRTLPTLKC